MEMMKSTVIEVENKGIKHITSYFVGNHSYFYWKYTLEKALIYFLGDKDFVR